MASSLHTPPRMTRHPFISALLIATAGCAVTVGPDDIADEGGEVLSEEDVAAEEQTAGEETSVIERAGGSYDYGAANTHAGRVNPHRRNHGRSAINRSSCLDGVARRWARR